jgi:uncharacterized membrane protein YhaH (DUF805 family)
MLGWIFLPFRRATDFRGRSRRLEFWAFSLTVWLVYAVLLFAFIGTGFSLDHMFDAEEQGWSTLASTMFGGAGLLIGVWWLVTLLPSLAVTVRRLHDRDLSGWWLVGAWIAAFIPLLNMLAWLTLLIVLMLPGNRGANQRGQDPKDPTGADIFA